MLCRYILQLHKQIVFFRSSIIASSSISNSNDEDHRINRTCHPRYNCNGRINCPWLEPDDEANCSKCPDRFPHSCNCRLEGNYSCKLTKDSISDRTCYSDYGKVLIIGYHQNTKKIVKVIICDHLLCS